MKLKQITKTITEINYNDLDEFIQTTYGWKNYEFVAVEECGNDSSHSFNPTGDVSDPEVFERWDKGEFVHYSNHAIMEKLVADGHIPAGDVLVEVCW